LNYLLIKEP